MRLAALCIVSGKIKDERILVVMDIEYAVLRLTSRQAQGGAHIACREASGLIPVELAKATGEISNSQNSSGNYQRVSVVTFLKEEGNNHANSHFLVLPPPPTEIGLEPPSRPAKMRRIPRLRQPSSAVLTQCLQTTPQHTAVSRTAATTTTTTSTSSTSSCLAARPREFSTTPSRPGRPSKVSLERAKRYSAARDYNQTKKWQGRLAEGEEAGALEMTSGETETEVPTEIETDLVVPPRETSPVPRSEDLVEGGIVDYKPATSAVGLEAVGGLDGWFDKETHLPESKLQAPRFAPRNKVTDPVLLQLCVRRAVVEALAAAQAQDMTDEGRDENNQPEDDAADQAPPAPPLLLRSWGGRASKEAAERALAVGVEVGKDGTATLTGDVDGVVQDLMAAPEEETSLSKASASASSSHTAHFGPADVKKMVEGFPPSWKKVSLRDERLKFAVGLPVFLSSLVFLVLSINVLCFWSTSDVRTRLTNKHNTKQVTKRIYQLTGHRVPDAKLIGDATDTARALLALVVKPPPATKVYDAIQQQGALTKLPHVEVLPRRRTPITEAIKVGSWKVIKDLLEKRRLPVTGTGGVGKFVEDEWYRGPRPAAKKGRKRA